MELATSDAHEGPREALQECFPALIWQRQEAHFRRNVLGRTPSGDRDEMHGVLDQVLEASSQQEARERLDSRQEKLGEKAPSGLQHSVQVRPKPARSVG